MNDLNKIHQESLEVQKHILHTLRAWLLTWVYIAVVLTIYFVFRVVGLQ